MNLPSLKLAFEKAISLGCCTRCTCCYFNLFTMNFSIYSKTEQEILNYLFKEERASSYDTETTTMEVDAIDTNPLIDNKEKLILTKRCKVCFGAFQDEYLHNKLPKQMELILKEYENIDSFHLSLSFSHHYPIREHCFQFILYNEFKDLNNENLLLTITTEIDKKRLFKSILSEIFEKYSNNKLKCLQSSNFLFEIKFDDEIILKLNENIETNALEYLSPLKKKRKKSKNDKQNNEEVQRILKIQDFKELEKIIELEVPKGEWKVNALKEDSIKEGDEVKEFVLIQGVHSVVYFSGYYKKLERGLPQSPWFMKEDELEEEKEANERSVDTLIGKPLLFFSKGDSYKMDSSGREDKNVRMLGNGRPFVFSVFNPRKPHFTEGQLLEMTKFINQESNQSIEIHTLQFHLNNTICQKMREGAEEKRKRYRCVVWCESNLITKEEEKKLTNKVKEYLENLKDVTIYQKTPLRVLHRRSQQTRLKIIHEMKVHEMINKHYLVLDLTTSAGTYVKEFINGDFGRTEPSFGSLLAKFYNQEIPFNAQILQLDVMDIEMQL
ncbi:hypothetical protein ABK040_015204 [Willaertia magna]